jgi:hypothetical protein
LQAVYHPLGFSVEIATNSRHVLMAAEESWGHFRKVFSEPPVQLRIGVLEGGPGEDPPAPVWRAQRNLLALVSDSRNFAFCDLTEGFGFCWLTAATVENRAYLRWHFLEGTVFALLNSLYLTSFHAACVSLAERGVLLCGDSGAGKSSLAFACARRGWTYLSDDSTRVVRGRKGHVVIGNPYQMRFRESAIELFPELKGQRIAPRAVGEMKIELATASLPQIATTSECSVDYIVFLNWRELGPPRLSRFPKEKALQWFEQFICFGEKEVRDAQKASLRNLVTAEAFELRYSDLDSAVKRLETLVRDGARPPGEFCISLERRENA